MDSDPFCDVDCEDTTTTTSTWTTTTQSTTSTQTTTPFTIIGLVVPRQPQLWGGASASLFFSSLILAGAWKLFTGSSTPRSPEGHLLVPSEEPPRDLAVVEANSRLPVESEPGGESPDRAGEVAELEASGAAGLGLGGDEA